MWSSKRPRTEDQSPSVSRRSQCRYKGCTRPTQEKERGMRHEFCGLTHQNLYMANLANSLFDSEFGERDPVHYLNSKMCKLPECGKPVTLDFDFCRKRHFLKFVEIYTQRWRAKGRLCNFEPCINHVWVDKQSKKCYEFCSLKHAAFASVRKGLQMRLDTPHTAPQSVLTIPAEEVVQTTCCQDILRCNTEMIESKLGYHAKILDADLEASLRAALLGGDLTQDPERTLVTNIDIREFHPWELVKQYEGFRPRFFLFFKEQGTFSGEGNKKVETLTTKDGFGWKQTSKPYPGKKKQGTKKQTSSTCAGKKLLRKYYSYELKGSKVADKKKEVAETDLPHVQAYKSERQTDANKRWKMHTISLAKEMSGSSNSLGVEFIHRIPMIWKIFQDPEGEPVWPPLIVDAEPGTAEHPEEGVEFTARTSLANTGMFTTVGIATDSFTPHREEHLHVPSRVETQKYSSQQQPEGSYETSNQFPNSDPSWTACEIPGNELLGVSESLGLGDGIEYTPQDFDELFKELLSDSEMTSNCFVSFKV